MTTKSLCLFSLLIALSLSAHKHLIAQVSSPGAVIVERRNLPTVPNRAFVLWMISPDRSDPIPEDEPYTCPDETRGNAFSGPARVSLINLSENRIINTIDIRDPHFPEKDMFEIPYEIRPGYHYLVNSANPKKASKPTILNFQDLNGDGDPAEFVLYDAPFCTSLQTALVGYSRSQDRVIQYQLDIEFRRGKESWQELSDWLEYIFSERPTAPGHYKFEIDYRGRGGSLNTYDVSYDRSLQRFRGSCAVQTLAPSRGLQRKRKTHAAGY